MEMTIAEKVSYIKGLVEGMKLDTETNEGKILAAIIDVLGDIAVNIEDIDEDLAELTDVVTDVEDAVMDLEDEIYGDEECDCCDCDDDELYDITCPACQNTVTADFDAISSGAINCPNCGEKLEFDLSALEDCDCCE